MRDLKENGAATLVAEDNATAPKGILSDKVASPRGYKKTKVGVIPEEWEVVRLGDVFDFIKTYSNSRSHLSDNGDIEYIHYGDIHTKYKFHLDLQKATLPKISNDKIKGNIYYVQEGDIIVADASEDYADIGKSVEIVNIGNKKVVSGLHTFLLRDKTNYFSNGYKGLLFYNHFIANEIKRIATGISVLGISKTNLQKLQIPLPPLKEQQKIAQILTTWDKAIEKLEALITVKEQLKKGLMQKLLSGEVRFKGFDGEWEEVRLGDVGITYGGLTGKKAEDFGIGNAKYVTYKNIFDNSKLDIELFEHVKIASAEQQNKVQYGDILFTTSSETPEEVGMSSVMLDNIDELYLNSFCFGYRVNDFEILNPNFARFYFRSFYMRDKISRLAQGSTRFNLSKLQVMKIKVKLPTQQEQQKIAQVLTTADKEIELLKKELEALKEQKRGLMQRLLTGEVRVKIDEGERL